MRPATTHTSEAEASEAAHAAHEAAERLIEELMTGTWRSVAEAASRLHEAAGHLARVARGFSP